MSKAIPVISFVGYSDSGKTTVIEGVIARLWEKGRRVAYLKHSHHEGIFPDGKKDTDKMLRAGATVSAVLADGAVLWMERQAPDIHEVIRQIQEVDVIILEGYKREKFLKILVTTNPDKKEWAVPECDCAAVVSDEPIDTVLPRFTRTGQASLCDWLLKYLGI